VFHLVVRIEAGVATGGGEADESGGAAEGGGRAAQN